MIFTCSTPVYLLDRAFDEKIDDYPDCYCVYEVKDFDRERLSGSWENLDLDKTFICSVKVANVVFDSSRRREIDLSFLERTFGEGEMDFAS